MSRPCANCGAETADGCQCSFAASDCFDITGSGSADNPFQVEPILDPDATNLAECNASGFGAFLPDEIANPPAANVYHTTPQSIANGVLTVLAFNSERYDTDSMHDNATNNNRITVQTAGVYSLKASLTWEGNSTGERRVSIRKNGTEILVSDERPTVQSDPFAQTVAYDEEAIVGDYFDIVVFQNSGVTLQVVVPPTSFERSPTFSAVRVAVG